MGLVAHEPVDHVDARLLELPRPLDVVGLVKARRDLDQRGHLLVVSAASISARTIGESPLVR